MGLMGGMNLIGLIGGMGLMGRMGTLGVDSTPAGMRNKDGQGSLAGI